MNDAVERTEVLLPGPAEGLASLLGVTTPQAGVPLLWHWIYLLDRPAQSDLGPDGHPMRGTIPAPPEPGRRRMWAGGQVRTLGELRFGETATRRTQVVATTDKEGRSGRLTFVTVNHRITQEGELKIDERQDIVYRDAPPAAASAETETPVEVAVGDGDWSIDVTPTLLFRYSALTYNGHRIHYDRDYARDVEGYPGLLTHGPLQAVVMAEAVRRQSDTSGPAVFDYRLVAPLFDHQGLVVRADVDGDSFRTTARDKHGRVTASGILHL